MKTMLLSIVIAIFIASPVHAVPITWVFSGTTLPNSGFIDENDVLRDISGLRFEFLIFLNTDLPPKDNAGRPIDPLNPPGEIDFGTAAQPQSAAIRIPGLGVLPVFPTAFVEYLRAGPTTVAFIDFQFARIGFDKQGLPFDPPIQTNVVELTPIMGTAPRLDGRPGLFSDNILEIPGPNLFVVGEVTLFTATVPEGGSTVLFLTSGLVALGFLRRR